MLVRKKSPAMSSKNLFVCYKTFCAWIFSVPVNVSRAGRKSIAGEYVQEKIFTSGNICISKKESKNSSKGNPDIRVAILDNSKKEPGELQRRLFLFCSTGVRRKKPAVMDYTNKIHE